ncbi:hypothetical protein ABTX60_42480 [Streptomyces sp. NPDC126510]|uniref:hypothetical protein n=1 Tax=Streptomyces sp. NPDC126510 TaxID=3155317 RepID=UPI00331AE48D
MITEVAIKVPPEFTCKAGFRTLYQKILGNLLPSVDQQSIFIQRTASTRVDNTS